MLFQATWVVTLLACVSSSQAADESNFTLHAYGDGITPGLKFFYGDGQAYVGANAPSFVSSAVNITLYRSPDDETKFLAKPDNPEDWSVEASLYIDASPGAIEPVGFVRANESLPDGATDNGFGLYGGWAYHKDDPEAALEMKFLATPTNESDVFLVKWNAGGTRAQDDLPITLRTQAPVVITD